MRNLTLLLALLFSVNAAHADSPVIWGSSSGVPCAYNLITHACISSGGGGGGGMIGDPTGGDPNDILFVDQFGNLGQDANFTFDGAMFSVPGIISTANEVQLGDTSGTLNGTIVTLNDSIEQITLNAQGGINITSGSGVPFNLGSGVLNMGADYSAYGPGTVAFLDNSQNLSFAAYSFWDTGGSNLTLNNGGVTATFFMGDGSGLSNVSLDIGSPVLTASPYSVLQADGSSDLTSAFGFQSSDGTHIMDFSNPGVIVFGDIDSVSHGLFITLDNPNYTISMGDVNDNRNGTYLQLNDNDETILATAANAFTVQDVNGYPFFITDTATNNSAWGDLDGNVDGSFIQMHDGNVAGANTKFNNLGINVALASHFSDTITVDNGSSSSTYGPGGVDTPEIQSGGTLAIDVSNRTLYFPSGITRAADWSVNGDVSLGDLDGSYNGALIIISNTDDLLSFHANDGFVFIGSPITGDGSGLTNLPDTPGYQTLLEGQYFHDDGTGGVLFYSGGDVAGITFSGEFLGDGSQLTNLPNQLTVGNPISNFTAFANLISDGSGFLTSSFKSYYISGNVAVDASSGTANSITIGDPAFALSGANMTIDNGSNTVGFTSNFMSFFGNAAAAPQTGGAQTAGAVYTTTEQDMLQKAYNALRTFGFLN